MWRAGSGLLGGDTDKSPLLATSCPHSSGRPAKVSCGAVRPELLKARSAMGNTENGASRAPASVCTLQACKHTPGPGRELSKGSENIDQ